METEMDKKAEGILQIVFALIIIALAIYLGDRASALAQYGYVGVFVVSLVASATILFPAPGWAAVIAMSPYLNPLGLGLAAGIGSAIGELTGYIAGEGAMDLLGKNGKKAGQIKEAVRKYGMAGIFLLAAIPNPLFDVAGIAAGSLRMSPWKFLFACAAGRTLRYAVLAYLGAFTLGLV